MKSWEPLVYLLLHIPTVLYIPKTKLSKFTTNVVRIHALFLLVSSLRVFILWLPYVYVTGTSRSVQALLPTYINEGRGSKQLRRGSNNISRGPLLLQGPGRMVMEWLLPMSAVSWAMGMMLLVLFPHYLLKPLPSSTSETHMQKVKKYLLLVAHPDDECMFFGPTLLSLTVLGGCEFHVLCISNGNADGRGACRTLEMVSSCCVFKVPAENVKVLDHPSLQDGHRQHWSQQLLVQIIAETVESQAIDCVITFDRYGVSGHPNHCALSHALRAYLVERSKDVMEDGQIGGWELESVNIVRKYSGVLEIFLSTLKWLWSRKGDCHCFVTPNPLISVGAMKQHKSQWLWYRRLFVIFASYTYVNSLRKIPVKRDELLKKLN